MSRSCKKTPSCHVVKRDGWYKKHYNRKLRRAHKLDIPSGNAYRKMNEPWNIDDFHEIGLSYERFHDSQICWGKYVDEATCRNQYAKWYLRK